MDPDAKQAQLQQNLLKIERFRHIRWIPQCGSTNTVLADEVRNPDPAIDLRHGSVLVTDRQTAGKGRLGRIWEAPVGASLAMSVRVELPNRPTEGQSIALLGVLPLAVGLATAHTIRTLGADPQRVELKWPNDVMDPETGRKYAGVLCESTGSHVIIGVGINLNRPHDVTGVMAERAQWIDQTGTGPHAPITQATAATALVLQLNELLTRLDQSIPNVLAEVRAACATIGRSVRIEQGTETWHGTAVDLDDGGALLVMRNDTGLVQVVHAGDVVHLRSMP